ncbi:Pentatricopeptide repeat-containing protein ELI1, chloroplastic [Ananas comosus]|uniref:Pentatricopeptide repeat-containing protein ELI1, chloroplastic n=1 Tax=Ananas comosus TaxID=4615 RepID=A0A199UI11_ANACO|nr:Pentatricopeptide repeat-containing protein ELI1, chloroplastic [Ananas comosus]
MPGPGARFLSFPLDPRRIKPILALAISGGLLLPSAAAAAAVAAYSGLLRALSLSPSPSPSLALPLFRLMLRSSLSPDPFSLPSLLRSCASSSPLLALALHALALRRGLLPHPHVATSLLHSYAASSSPGLLPHALQLFDEMPRRTTVTFNALLSRLARYSDAGRAHGLLLFSRMLSSGPPPRDTLAAALLCCAGLGALALAAPRTRSPRAGAAAPRPSSARASDASAWTAMIAALAAHARGEDAVHLFDEMVGRENLSPDSLTFTCALHACANSGMAERGLKLFDEMQSVYGIKPRMEHYGAIVDLLGRAGRIDAAERVVSSMPFEPNRAVWGALLHACAHNTDSALAEKLGKRISELGLGLGFDVGVSNLYARVGRWEEVGEVRDRMVLRGVQKEKGFSSVEVNGEMVKFLVGDVRHPLTLEIYDLLERIGAVIMVFDG